MSAAPFRLVHRCRWIVKLVMGPHLNNVLGDLSIWELEDGTRFAVRENLGRKGDQFWRGGGIGAAFAHGKATGLPEVLDLLAPRDRWEEIAELVRAADPLERPVRDHLQMTREWVESEVAHRARVPAMTVGAA